MRTINAIVLHYTASDDVSAATIDDWHRQRGFSQIGYHKVIRRDGSLEQGRPESAVGAHTRGHNEHTLGITLTGADFFSWYPTPAQYQTLVSVLINWLRDYRVFPSQIFLHQDLNATQCPGRLDKKYVLRRIAGKDEPLPKLPPEPVRSRLRTLRLTNPYIEGEDVKTCQKELEAKADGLFGPGTECGVRIFQHFFGLEIAYLIYPPVIYGAGLVVIGLIIFFILPRMPLSFLPRNSNSVIFLSSFGGHDQINDSANSGVKQSGLELRCNIAGTVFDPEGVG